MTAMMHPVGVQVVAGWLYLHGVLCCMQPLSMGCADNAVDVWLHGMHSVLRGGCCVSGWANHDGVFVLCGWLCGWLYGMPCHVHVCCMTCCAVRRG
jgi:hypothetical protein